MSNENETNYLAKAKKRNRKAAGITEIKGSNHIEKFINRNRLARGLDQKPAGFKSKNKDN